MRILAVTAAIALACLAPAHAQTAPAALPPGVAESIAQLKAKAAQSDLGYEIVRDLVTEVGPRPTGWENDARAREWAMAKMKSLGFTNVHVEPFTLPAWRRTAEKFEITSPAQQQIVGVALGWSKPTPAEGVEGEVVRFANLAALAAAPAGSLAGKVAFIDEKMARTMDGTGYGVAQVKRRRAPQLAAEKGAIASLIRTAGTNPERVANTGQATPGGTPPGALTPIPAAALSNPDADLLARLVAKAPTRMRVTIQVETKTEAQSGNVVGEIKGREKPDEVIIVGGHIDTWDITPGANDDGTGVAASIAAAKLVADITKQKPRRTIRVVLFGAEEPGDLGAKAYAEAHKGEVGKMIAAAESDAGGGVVWRLRTKFGDPAKAAALASVLGDLAIVADAAPARGSSDVGELGALGVPVIDLTADTSRYFDVHHTMADTISKVDPDAFRQQVTAYATFVLFASETGWDFRAKP